jgi:hypothetical protein
MIVLGWKIISSIIRNAGKSPFEKGGFRVTSSYYRNPSYQKWENFPKPGGHRCPGGADGVKWPPGA